MRSVRVRIDQGTGPLVDALPFSDAEFRRRLDGVRRTMAARDLAAFISFTPENIYYLTGHDTPGYYFYQACVVTPDRLPVNVLRRIETTNTLGRSWSRLAAAYEDREDPVATTLGVLHELGLAGKTVGAEADSWFVTPRRFAALQEGIEASGGRLTGVAGIVEDERLIKSAEELTHMRAAAKAAARGMRAAVAASRDGTTENEVAAVASAELIRAGAEYAGLPPFITSGPRTSLAHSTWAGRTYAAGDVLNYELPGVVKRYCAALYRCGTVGRPTAEVAQRAAVVMEALAAVIAAIRPGATSGAVHNASKAVFQEHGLGDMLGHRTGYSVGVNYAPDWGEGQIMSIWDGDERPLRSGMTFHLVPGIYDLGRYTIIISETVHVTDAGCEVLTEFPRELFAV
ncbi:MAG TPA: Xaa-Pro peptidase family protein [bacterium]|nr:Xaa-Pro peptidase family protein [bacterium]